MLAVMTHDRSRANLEVVLDQLIPRLAGTLRQAHEADVLTFTLTAAPQQKVGCDPARQRSDRNAARMSVEKSSGSSQAAKWPPLSTSWKYVTFG